MKLDSLGVPYVHLSAEIAVSKPGGRIGYAKKIRWQPYMSGAKAQPAESKPAAEDAPVSAPEQTRSESGIASVEITIRDANGLQTMLSKGIVATTRVRNVGESTQNYLMDQTEKAGLLGDDAKAVVVDAKAAQRHHPVLKITKSLPDGSTYEIAYSSHGTATGITLGKNTPEVIRSTKYYLDQALAKMPTPVAQDQAKPANPPISEDALTEVQLLREERGRWQYKFVIGSTWMTANTKEDAVERATATYWKTPEAERLTSQQRADKAEADEFAQMDANYKSTSVADLKAKYQKLGSEIAANQAAGAREFNGNGGRRTGPAVSSEAARAQGEEKMRLKRYIAKREQLEGKPAVPAYDRMALQRAHMAGAEGQPGGEMAPAQAEAPKVDELSEREQAAKAKGAAALAKLAALAGKNLRMNWTPEEEQKLLPIVIDLFDSAMELGYVKFKKAVRYVRELIAGSIGQETADAIPFETLQGAYVHTARNFKDKGATSGKDVMSFESLDQLENSVDPESIDPNGAQVTYLHGEIQQVPVADLALSKDVPQFKEGADAKGVTQESRLSGKYDKALAAPIQVWERLNGDLEVVSGRHRLDLAQRSGETTISAQVHKESQGFTAETARQLDVELNVKDGRGKVKDYVNYFKEFKLTKEQAREDGLLNTAVGRTAYEIATNGGQSLIAAHASDAITDEAAASIAQNAPGNEALQNLGMKYVQDGKSINFAVNTMRSARAAGFQGNTEDGDLFGFDDSFAKEAEAISNEATKQQRAARSELAAISGAAKRPELARQGGVNVKSQKVTDAKIAELKARIIELESFDTNPEIYRQLRVAAGLTAQAPEAPVNPDAPIVNAMADTAAK